jgi:outer membrane protein assembly factor BamB
VKAPTTRYAVNARTGKQRWSFDAGDPISGSPTVLDGVVYFSSLGGMTWGLDARTGRRLWKFPDGKYTPVTASGDTVYLCGVRTIYALVPKEEEGSPGDRAGGARAVR